MSGESVEIGIEAIAGEERHAARSQLLAQAVNEQMSHAMGARTQQQHGHAFGERIDGHPEPQDLCVAAQPRAEFIELQMGEGEHVEGAFMQALSMRSSA